MSEIVHETAAQFRAHALNLFKRAEATSDPSARTIYIELASQWVQLAQRFEDWENTRDVPAQ